jgi:hypothetical protein
MSLMIRGEEGRSLLVEWYLHALILLEWDKAHH